MKRIIASMMMLCLTAAYAQEKTDTTLMQEVTVSNSKDNRALRDQPLASTTIDTHEIISKGMHSMTDLASYVPNLFIPA